jgi:hypothetical protein
MDKNKLETYLKKLSAVEDTTCSLRGSMMQWASEIENEVSNILAWCFHPTKYLDADFIDELLNNDGIIFKSTILRKIDLYDKINFLKDIIIAKYPEVWRSHCPFIQKLIKQLHKVRNFRNLMAHSASDLSINYISSIELSNNKKSKELQVLEYSNGKIKKTKIVQSQIIKELLRCYITSLNLKQLFFLINKDQDNFNGYEKFIHHAADRLEFLERKKN